MENLNGEKLDNPLPCRRKLLSLYHANNLIINIMKALQILQACLKGEFQIERAGIADSDAVIMRGWFGYFGARHYFGSIKPGETLFYLYLDKEEVMPNFPVSDVSLVSSDNEGRVLIWKIEN